MREREVPALFLRYVLLMTYAVTRMLAHIEKGETRDSFGQMVMGTLCGAHVSISGRRAGEQTGLKDPMFYRVCGSCRRIERQKKAKEASGDDLRMHRPVSRDALPTQAAQEPSPMQLLLRRPRSGLMTSQPPTRTPHGDGFLEEHPAYAMVGAYRVSAGPPGIALYGSDFLHQHYVSIKIVRSEMARTGSHDYHHSIDQLIEVNLSEAQWATFVSAMNVGYGVPCTLNWLPGERIPEITRTQTRRQLHRDEVGETMQEAIEALDELIAAAPTKKLRALAERARREITDGVPWVTEQFEVAAEKTIEKAKIEINAYTTMQVQRAGLAALLGEGRLLELADPDNPPDTT